MDAQHDFDLRPPLPPGQDYPLSLAFVPGKRRDDRYRPIHSIQCRMYAASRVLCLCTEARFAALVLFHRYCAARLIDEDEKREGGGNGRAGKSGEGRGDSDGGWRDEKHLGAAAAACLFLGCKSEEEPRRIRDVINLSHMLGFEAASDEYDGGGGGPYGAGDGAASSAAASTAVRIREAADPPELDESYWAAKERIVSTEQAVLRMIKFDVSVCHPHRAALLVLDALGSVIVAFEMAKLRRLVHGTWRALNDALFHPPALRHGTLVMACAAILLAEERGAGTKKGEGTRDGKGEGSSCMLLPPQWWSAFGVGDDEMLGAVTSLRDAAASL